MNSQSRCSSLLIVQVELMSPSMFRGLSANTLMKSLLGSVVRVRVWWRVRAAAVIDSSL